MDDSDLNDGSEQLEQSESEVASQSQGSDDSDDLYYKEETELQRDLKRALKQDHFSFSGNFYHAGLQPFAPNPCMSITGLGLIGLPLSDYDAKRMISAATLAPFGHGERTVIDKTVRDTWEIDPEKITFVNPAWNEHIDKAICTEVCTALGVSASVSKMELYKLLLYETGSHFLPHQDTQKASGMFATVVIILPSTYEGGQLIVSHASRTKTIDFSENSTIATAVLAWYTDVRHEVKPIISGYRLALSYNLIHTARSEELCPTLPDMGKATRLLERALRKWKEQLTRHESEQHIYAYLLDHEYSLMNLSDGLTFLKGADAHRVRSIRPIAESLGFVLAFASLEQHVAGSTEDDGADYYSRNRRCYSEEDSDEDMRRVPDMIEIGYTETKLRSLTGLDGRPLFGVTKPMTIPEEALIPANPFRKVQPDRKEYEGYMGNGAGGVDHWYKRTVLLILNAQKRDDLLFEVEGLPLAFKMIHKNLANPPSSDNLSWAERILRKRSTWTKEHLTTMMKYSLHWKNDSLWNNSTKSPLCTLDGVDSKLLVKSCSVFSFSSIRLSLEDILARSGSKTAVEKVSLIREISAKATGTERPAIDSWSAKEIQKALASFTVTGAEDVPAIAELIKRLGLHLFVEQMFPSLRSKAKSYDFWITLHSTFLSHRHAFLHRSTTTIAPAETTGVDSSVQSQSTSQENAANPDSEMLNALIRDCLALASLTALDVAPSRTHNYPYYNRHITDDPFRARMDRTLLLVELCIRTSQLEICGDLLHRTLKMPGDLPAKFAKFYVPFVPRLTALLTKFKKRITTAPFGAFAEKVIGKYLAEILGKQGHVHPCGLRKVGCRCGDCDHLDNFILNPRQSTITFTMNKQRRNHLENQLRKATDLCTVEQISYGRPQGIKVTKKPAVVWACNWSQRLEESKSFLASFGSSEILSEIMGPRLKDLHAALKGNQYVLAPDTIQGQEAPLDATQSELATSSGQASRNSNETTQHEKVAKGQKRKSAPLKQLDVIDFTGDDSS